MKAPHRIISICILMFACALASAQGKNVTAKLIDKNTEEPVAYATVSLIPSGAQKASKYALSSEYGDISIAGVKKGSYTVKVELLGYNALTKNVTVAADDVNLGLLEMEPDTKMLDAAKVTDVGNPITIKKDTIEYNATLIKQSDNDMLIDLLKKLPGIEVDSDGSITANGKTIKKITIDGKTFFLDDPQLATKNIPSKIIEKVKVVDKKSDQAMFTGIDDGEEETIIDLGVKKGMMKGWFGNFMAGGGHDVPSPNNSMNDWRYQGAGFVGNFTDKQQISVILNGNNTNNRGFNDLAGNMMGGMRGGRGGRGGGNDSGITTSWMGGVNGAWNLLDNRMDLGGNYLYNGSIKDVTEQELRDTYISDSQTQRHIESGSNHTFTNGHRLGMRLEHKFSDNTSIVFEPRFNIGGGNFADKDEYTTHRFDNTDPEGTMQKVNQGFSSNSGSNNNWTASGWGLLRQKLGKPGRTMTVNLRYNVSRNKMEGLNQSFTDVEGSYMPEIVDQRYFQNQDNNSLTGGVTYTEPLYKQMLFLEANYSYTWNNQQSNKDTYDGMHDGTYSPEKNKTYSNTINNTSHNHRAGANLMFQKDKISVQLGFSANPTTTINETMVGDNLRAYRNQVLNWSPQASVRYEVSDNNNLRFYYWGRSNQPSTSQLMPVPDNSDPLRVSLGNPYLTPYFNHSMRGMYRFTNKQTFTSVNASLEGGIQQNPIVNTSWYEKDGRQFSLPSNGPTAFNANTRIMLNSPLGKSKVAGMFSIFNMLRLSYNNSSSFIKNGNTLNMQSFYVDDKGQPSEEFNYDLFHKEVPNIGDHPDFATNTTQTFSFTERFRLTFRCDLVEVNIGARTRMNKSWYSIVKGNVNQNPTWNSQVDLSMNWNIPGGVAIIPEYNYNWYNGYTTPQQDVHMLNLEITKLLFKNKFTLALKGYDLLGQSRNLSVSDTANYHSETVNNTLGRYIILSLTYRFGTFDKGKMGGGPGMGGPGRGPMGGRGKF